MTENNTIESKIKNMFKKKCISRFEKCGIKYTNEDLEQAANIFYEKYKTVNAAIESIDLEVNSNYKTIKTIKKHRGLK